METVANEEGAANVKGGRALPSGMRNGAKREGKGGKRGGRLLAMNATGGV